MRSGSVSRSSMRGAEAAPVSATAPAGAPVRGRHNAATSFPGFEAVADAVGLRVEVVDARG